MASVLLLGCPEGYASLLPEGTEGVEADELSEPSGASGKPDLVVIGPMAPMASVLAQRVGRAFVGVELLIVARGAEVARIKELLRISPYIPLCTDLVNSEPSELLEQAVRAAVVRCTLRKGHRAVLDSARQKLRTNVGSARTKTSTLPSVPLPRDVERRQLLGFFRVYEQVRSGVLRDVARATPELGAAAQALRAAIAANDAESDLELARLERAAVLDEAWEPYMERLHAVGRTHAEIGLGFGPWLEISYHFRRCFVERMRQLEDVEAEHSADILFGMESFLRIILSEMERAHAAAHDALLSRHEANARLFAVAVESSDAAVLTASLDGTLTALNPAAEHLLGYRAGEALGIAVSELTRADLRPALAARLSEAAGGVPTRGFATIWRNRLGREVHVSLTLSPVKVAEGRAVGVSIVAHDVTKQRQTEEFLKQTQKMEAVGRLAGGIAHDFNNLLTVIISHASFMSAEREPTGAEREGLFEILQAADRASALTRQLLMFTRGQPVAPTRIDVSDVVRSTHRLLRRTLSESIEIVFLPSESLWPVWMDLSQLEQLVMNLALNARDAMPEGGKLLIELENETRTEPSGALPAGDYVRLQVGDTGIGMAPDVLSHIFEPFFTTKPLGNGTGLGLVTCHAIARRAGGDIAVFSEPGRGTTFSVWLPRAAHDERAVLPVVRGPDFVALTGTETILVVEDDSAVRTAATLALERYGYRALPALNGDDARRIIRQNPTIALVLTDVVMPQLSGPELAKHLARVYPDLPVLFMTGYAEHGILNRGAVSDSRIIFKPFVPAELARKVRRLLDDRARRPQ